MANNGSSDDGPDVVDARAAVSALSVVTGVEVEVMVEASKVRLAVPEGAGTDGSIVFFRSSTSRRATSCSICDLKSFDARRNSASSFPAWRAISGNFFGPKMTSARKNRKMVSEKLMRS